MPKSQLFCLIASAIAIAIVMQTTEAFSLSTAKSAEITSDTAMDKTELFQGRTFGRIKRMLPMLLIPIAYKMGVFSVVIGVILALVIKSVMIGKAILFLNLAFAIFKLGSLFKKPHSYGSEGWDHKKNIHIHLHGAQAGHQTPWSMPPEYHATYSNIATT
ncbi:uncharacterized protein LOC134830436 [Culicoides brevitarsis]|uniref:uncharacterized protein LOC134830436 n=1 Tax=Culicoides brevitarsis TaxID=469753 RepID=UPI00307BB2C3